ncbi:Vacuolar protein sorting-associated protein 52 [Podila clonocystis]|nr:Vacuolar protein sorting-associated protein 52 [Podila clonocystis]
MPSEEVPVTPIQNCPIARRNSQKHQSMTGLKFLNELLDDHDHDNDDLALEQVGDRISEFQEDEFVKQALAKGMDLREYAHYIESELDIVGQDHEDDYVHQSQAFVDLHGQIKSCDEILETMENLLSIFQTDLGNISAEIQTLQTKSVSMSIQLKNRMTTENHLNCLLEGVVVTPQLIRKIYDGEVDDTWLAATADLNSRMHHAKSRQGRHIRALKEVGPELERLRIKAVEKIREFLLTKIKSFRTPNTNVQIMQHSVLLKYKELNQFVMERHTDVATEIRQTYANTLRWYFSNQFEHYALGLEKLQVRKLLGKLRNQKGKNGSSDKDPLVLLIERHTLKNHDAGLILIHVANEKNLKYPYETLFRSFNLALIDNASSEYLFLIEYFAKRSLPDIEGIQCVFTHIFEPTLKLGLTNVKEYADSSYDAIGILLCLRINHQLAKELERRKIPTLDKYRDAIHMVLWPRFQVVVDMHIDSVRKAKTKIKPKNVHPHWDVRTPAAEVENEHWKTALHQSIALFVEEELDPYFGDLISFIKMVNISGGVSKVSLEHFERASYNFTNSWRQSLLAINTSVIQHFSSFKNGTLVLHQVLGQLIVYYTRFHAMLDEKLQQLQALAAASTNGVTTSTRGWSHQPVGVQTVMVEVKKFRSNFLP